MAEASLILPESAQPAFWRRAVRLWHMVRHVPARQMLRRLELTARFRLHAHLPDTALLAPPPAAAAAPPAPLFTPRHLLAPEGHGFTFRQPWGTRPLPRPVDWSLPGRDPLTASWRANLHYMEFLEGVDDALFVALVEDWIARNPRRAPGAFRDGWRPYNLSIRVVVWMQQLAARGAHLPAAFRARAVASLAEQLRFLERHLERDIRGNHLVRNLKALLWAGAFFAGSAEGRHWTELGRELLAAELAEQILADGCHYERSPSYHGQVLGDLLECLTLLGRTDPLRERLGEALDRMALACARLSHPDGGVALFNDGGLGLAYAPAELLAAHAALRPAIAVPPGPFALPAAGFWGLQGTGESLIVDCGAIAPDALIGHGHGDILSFEWSSGGRRIVVDQGTFQYEDGPHRVQSRSTRAHNTVSIDQAEQCDFYGAHRCGRRARPILRSYRPEGAGFSLEGSHDGFDHLPGRPRHVRRIEATPGRLLIRDRIEGMGSHSAEAGLLFHPDCRVEVRDGTARIENGPVAVRLEANVPLRAEPAEWYPNLHTALPARRLRLMVPPGPDGLVVTLRRLDPAAPG